MGASGPQLPAAKPSRGTPGPGASPRRVTPTGLSPSTAGLSSPLRLPRQRRTRAHNTTSPTGFPRGIWFGLSPFRSPLLRGSLLVSLPPPTKMFPFGGFPLRGISPEHPGLFGPGRKPHSGIPGSTAACAYPGLIAACHALLRRPTRAIHRAACWCGGGSRLSLPPRLGPAASPQIRR